MHAVLLSSSCNDLLQVDHSCVYLSCSTHVQSCRNEPDGTIGEQGPRNKVSIIGAVLFAHALRLHYLCRSTTRRSKHGMMSQSLATAAILPHWAHFLSMLLRVSGQSCHSKRSNGCRRVVRTMHLFSIVHKLFFSMHWRVSQRRSCLSTVRVVIIQDCTPLVLPLAF